MQAVGAIVATRCANRSANSRRQEGHSPQLPVPSAFSQITQRTGGSVNSKSVASIMLTYPLVVVAARLVNVRGTQASCASASPRVCGVGLNQVAAVLVLKFRNAVFDAG